MAANGEASSLNMIKSIYKSGESKNKGLSQIKACLNRSKTPATIWALMVNFSTDKLLHGSLHFNSKGKTKQRWRVIIWSYRFIVRVERWEKVCHEYTVACSPTETLEFSFTLLCPKLLGVTDSVQLWPLWWLWFIVIWPHLWTRTVNLRETLEVISELTYGFNSIWERKEMRSIFPLTSHTNPQNTQRSSLVQPQPLQCFWPTDCTFLWL